MKPSVIVFILVEVLYVAGSKAQFTSFEGDARSQGMANARVMLASQWSGLDNPAGLAGISSTSFGLCYTNYFQIPELGLGAVSCGIPTKTGNYGLSFMTFGSALFRRSQASLSYGRSFGEKIRAGIGLHYSLISQPAGYGNLFSLIPSLGIQFLPLKWMTFGIHVFNPAGQQYIPTGYQHIPAGFHTGIGLTMGNEVLLCLEVEKILKEKARYYGGFEIILQKEVPLRFGISSGEFTEFSFGIGFRSRQLNFDLAATRHPILGFSPTLGLTYSI